LDQEKTIAAGDIQNVKLHDGFEHFFHRDNEP
jgi:hypothetical protein